MEYVWPKRKVIKNYFVFLNFSPKFLPQSSNLIRQLKTLPVLARQFTPEIDFYVPFMTECSFGGSFLISG
jgi:hypothetical protein